MEGDEIRVADLPSWLQQMILKKLGQRMSRENAVQMMSGELGALNPYFEQKGGSR